MKSLSVTVCSFPTSSFEYMSSSQSCHWYTLRAISPPYGTVSVAHNEQHPLCLIHLCSSVAESHPPNCFKNVVAFWNCHTMFSDYKKTLPNRLQIWFFLKNTPTGFLLQHEEGRGLTPWTWWTQVKSSSHKFRLTAVSIVTWRAMLCPQLSFPEPWGKVLQGDPCSRGYLFAVLHMDTWELKQPSKTPH